MTTLLPTETVTVRALNVRFTGAVREASVRSDRAGLSKLVGDHPKLDDHGGFSLVMNDESTSLPRNQHAEQLVQTELGLHLVEGDHFMGNVLILGPVVDGAPTVAPERVLRHAVCPECGDPVGDQDVHAGWGMCGSCVHNALRSGWEPPPAA